MIPKPFAFVLMPFSDHFRDTYLLGIKPACEDAGYYCERLDEQIFEERMLDRIYNQIAKADIVVADLTDRNPNVFYETGYAHALGKRVILLTRNADDIPFDLKHHFHIVYSDGIVELKRLLRERAAYFYQHPSATTRNPLDQVALLLNGKTVDTAEVEQIVDVPMRARRVDADFVVSIGAAFHLSDASVDANVEINVRLISPSTFSKCGWEISPGSSHIYSTITMPDGTVMHKPLSSLEISSGDPEQVVFELYQSVTNPLPHQIFMTMRLISEGLRRDVKLRVVKKQFLSL